MLTRRDKRVIFIKNGERVLVNDLGFAKNLASLSGFSVIGGTPYLSAPEQFSGDLVTHRSDIYAIARLVEWFVKPVEATSNTWLNQLRGVLQPALSTDMSDRPTSATLFMDEIRLAIEKVDVDESRKLGSNPGCPNPTDKHAPVLVGNDDLIQLTSLASTFAEGSYSSSTSYGSTCRLTSTKTTPSSISAPHPNAS